MYKEKFSQQHYHQVLGIDCRVYNKTPHVKERVQQLERRFVVHGGNIKKRGAKRTRPGDFPETH
jgi:hypothetical protein